MKLSGVLMLLLAAVAAQGLVDCSSEDFAGSPLETRAELAAEAIILAEMAKSAADTAVRVADVEHFQPLAERVLPENEERESRGAKPRCDLG